MFRASSASARRSTLQANYLVGIDRSLHIACPSPRLVNFKGFVDINATFANCD
jgi:hypothetical protein